MGENGEHGRNASESEVLGPYFGKIVVERIRKGWSVDDWEFDRLYPTFVRDLSPFHWTPIQVAKKAAALAVKGPGTKVLDVGSGVGKFCIVGALTTSGRFVGLEQRNRLVDIAENIVNDLEVSNVFFLNGSLDAVDWANFDSIYLYNPFSENLDEAIRIDDTKKLQIELYFKYVQYTQAQLSRMNSGARVVTYNGFGGELPPSYICIHTEEINFMKLEVWEQK